MRHSPRLSHALLLSLIMLVTAASVTAVAPTPEAIEKWKAEGVWEEVVAKWKAFKEAGGCSPVEHPVFDKEKHRQNLALGMLAPDTAYVIVILVDFSDNPYTDGGVAGLPYQFDSILFTTQADPVNNPSGSMTDYYLEVSYGQFYVKGDIYGWYRMDSTYEWYASDDYGQTRGPTLAEHAIAAADEDGADFSKYDVAPPSNICDGVIVIHAGRGAEEGVSGIWSHKGSFPWPGLSYDGVTIRDYTMNPEESDLNLSPIGVFCHEYGHFLGLPDLYDIDYDPASSDGLGDWALMARGNYLGSSKYPAHMVAWCKARAGFLNLTQLTSNTYQSEIPTVDFNPVAYKLKNTYTEEREYWVVENRQKVGFDKYLPGTGLCIYHVDTGAPANNFDHNRYYVALEQADGNNDLALTVGNYGDAGDPWPGSTNKREFHDRTTPDTKTNEIWMVSPASTTKIGVWRISDSDSLMYADFDVTEYSRPYVMLSGGAPLVFTDDPPGGDGDGVFEAGETIQFYCTIINYMRGSYKPRAALSTGNPDVTFVTNDVLVADNLLSNERNNAANPIEFTLSDTIRPVIEDFTLTITTDSLETTPGSSEFSTSFRFEVELGAPQVLIVDDDRGEDFEAKFEDVFYQMRIPSDVWHKQTQGSPTGADLLDFKMVFWHTGDSASSVLTGADMTAMKQFMDGGGNLMLSTTSGVLDINVLDPTLLTDYFHASYVGDMPASYFGYFGVPDNPVTTGTRYRFDQSRTLRQMQGLAPANGGQIAFLFGMVNPTGNIAGVTYAESYKSVLVTFPIEFLDNSLSNWNTVDTLLERVMVYFGGIASAVYDGQPFSELPRNFDLHQNYPNPFNPATNLAYTLRATGGFGRKAARTNLSIYNVLGQHVKTLVDEVQVPGTYVVTWDGTDRVGRPVASGVYFYRLVRGNDSDTRKMVLLK